MGKTKMGKRGRILIPEPVKVRSKMKSEVAMHFCTLERQFLVNKEKRVLDVNTLTIT